MLVLVLFNQSSTSPRFPMNKVKHLDHLVFFSECVLHSTVFMFIFFNFLSFFNFQEACTPVEVLR